MRAAVLILAGIVLTSCAAQVAQREAERDEITCSYAPKGSQAYMDCRRELAVARTH
jgi:hypothetical protein